MENTDEVKYCVTAYIDLLGFETHLEIGADLRTTIGKKAIDRLRNLENAITIVEDELGRYPEFYPMNWDIRRINDALILTMDLPSTLRPEVGQIAPYGHNRESNDELQKRLKDLDV